MMSGVERAERSVWSIFRCSKDRLAPNTSRCEFRILRGESGASRRLSYARKIPPNTQSFGVSAVDMTPYNAISDRILLWKPEKTYLCRNTLIVNFAPEEFASGPGYQLRFGKQMAQVFPDSTPKHTILLPRSDNASEEMQTVGDDGIVKPAASQIGQRSSRSAWPRRLG